MIQVTVWGVPPRFAQEKLRALRAQMVLHIYQIVSPHHPPEEILVFFPADRCPPKIHRAITAHIEVLGGVDRSVTYTKLISYVSVELRKYFSLAAIHVNLVQLDALNSIHIDELLIRGGGKECSVCGYETELSVSGAEYVCVNCGEQGQISIN